MGWIKNAFRYLIWSIYTVMTCGTLAGLMWGFCIESGIKVYWGILAVVLLLAGIGGVTYLVHRLAPSLSSASERNRRVFGLLEAAVVVIFLVAGIILRSYGFKNIEMSSVYYDAAKVMDGNVTPWMPHAATYIYVRALHGTFVLLGNHFVIGIWIQILLQFAALLALFFAVRKLAGSVSALVIFGFCACAPYMVREALVLSPKMLYLLFFMSTVVFIIRKHFQELKPGILWLTGVLTAFACYLDIMGCLLIYLVFVLLFSRRNEGIDVRKKISAAWRYIVGVLLGILGCFFLDASLSGTTIWRVIRTWLLLYESKGFRWPVIMDSQNLGLEAFVLFGLMVFGIFSFWYNRQKESVTACMLALCGLVSADCFGVFTEEMPGFLSVYLLFVILAGIGVGGAFFVMQGKADERYGWETLIEKMEENESRREALEKEKGAAGEENQIQYIENPLPLPKKHVKRTLDYSLRETAAEDDFDYPVSEEDDFDI